MRLLRSDLPLAGDASARFLPWIIGCMVYLAALALAGTMAADTLAERWHADLAGTFTFQLPPLGERAATIERVVALASGTPGVAAVRVISEADKKRLLEPWVGPDGLPADVPLPDLVVVELAPGSALEVAGMRARLAEIAPGASLEDHAEWQSDLLAFTSSVQLLALIVIGLILVAAVTTVVFVTRTGLDIHRRVIEIVHLVGARDSYIARQFLIHALRLGLIGGAIGVALAAATLVGLFRLFGEAGTALLPVLSLGVGQWILLALLPVGVSLVAMVTAHLTVLVTLNRGL